MFHRRSNAAKYNSQTLRLIVSSKYHISQLTNNCIIGAHEFHVIVPKTKFSKN